MRYYMKQKAICFGNDFTIKDEDNRDAFFVDGKAFTFGHQLSFQDMTKNELAFISQKLFKFRPTYTITSRGRELAKVTKSLFTIKDRFLIDVPGPDDITVVGKLIDHEYKFYRNKEVIAEVSKKIFSIRDTYGINISATHDQLLILCSAVVLDMCCHTKKK
ncbi:LURP-one-related family protein [Oligoflexia bacterium]|nr:LURP-one-related family protein [Oligoflexia bacterium]